MFVSSCSCLANDVVANVASGSSCSCRLTCSPFKIISIHCDTVVGDGVGGVSTTGGSTSFVSTGWLSVIVVVIVVAIIGSVVVVVVVVERRCRFVVGSGCDD